MSLIGTPDPDPEDGHDPHHSDDPNGWLSPHELELVRSFVPILYVEALPVHVGASGRVEEVGLLLRVSESDSITRTIVSGRVRFGESIREALLRHLENDIGPISFPQLPLQATPQAVGEYFPVPSEPGELTDSRQHAVSLAYVVPVTGTCDPRQDALELTWMTPDQVRSPEVLADMEGHRGVLVNRLLCAVGA